jgi:hypothetical protein
VSTIRVPDIGALASARIGSAYQVAALARRSPHPALTRYLPLRAEWAHGFRPGMDARLAEENAAPTILGHPAAAFVPRGPNNSDPIPGTGGAICLPIHISSSSPRLWNPKTWAMPIPCPLHLVALHVDAQSPSANNTNLRIRIPALGFDWEQGIILFGTTFTHSAPIPLDFALRTPALLVAELTNYHTPTANLGLRANVILSYRHIAPLP